MTMYDVVNYVDCPRERQLEILSLRNREEVRRWMTHPEPISEENHFRFVERLKEDGDRLYYAVYKDGALVGTYNLTRGEDGVWERGIIAAPETQGRGETLRWERQILSTLPGRGIRALAAKVKPDNLRSVRYHAKLGFREQSRDGEYIHYLLRLP